MDVISVMVGLWRVSGEAAEVWQAHGIVANFTASGNVLEEHWRFSRFCCGTWYCPGKIKRLRNPQDSKVAQCSERSEPSEDAEGIKTGAAPYLSFPRTFNAGF